MNGTVHKGKLPSVCVCCLQNYMPRYRHLRSPGTLSHHFSFFTLPDKINGKSGWETLFQVILTLPIYNLTKLQAATCTCKCTKVGRKRKLFQARQFEMSPAHVTAESQWVLFCVFNFGPLVAKPRTRSDRNLVSRVTSPRGTYVQSFRLIDTAVTKHDNDTTDDTSL
jgi:hypothetical protein